MHTLHNGKLRWQVPSTVILLLFILVPSGWSQGIDSGKRAIDVATINLYVGADFSPVLSLDPTDPNFPAKLLSGVATIYGHIQQSSFHTRADALARQIVARAPDLVALQEVTLIRRQTPGDSLLGGTVPATEPHLDYLDILLEALKRYGAHYEVVSQVHDVDVEVPLPTGPTSFDDLRLTDRDVILARQDLPPGHLRTSNPQGANFVARIPLPIGVPVLRGWCSIDVQVRGRQFRLISTHLEDRVPPGVQLGQAFELLEGPANTTLPVILAGDFNTDAFANYSPETYLLLTNLGKFSDIWQVAGGNSRGLTWGHDALLADVTVPFVLRLDLILFRGNNLEATEARIVDPVIGTVPPLWFSDHAAVFGTFAVK